MLGGYGIERIRCDDSDTLETTGSDPFLERMCLREIWVLRWSLLNPCGQSGVPLL